MTNTQTTACHAFAHIEDDWDSAARYLSIFIDECQQTLDELTEALLALEAGGGREGIEQLFIGAHRIKGSAASIGLNRPAKLAHLMEDLLQVLVNDGRSLEPTVADGLLACTDGLRQYVNAIKSGRPEEDQFDLLAQQLLDAQSESQPIQPVAADAPAAPNPPLAESAAVDADGETATAVIGDDLRQQIAALVHEEEIDNALVGQVVFEPDLPLVGLKARLVCSKLTNLGEVRFLDPPLEGIEDRETIGALSFGLITERPLEAVRRHVQVAGVREMTIEPLERRRFPAKDRRVSSIESSVKPTETLRVDIERLDRLMNLAGQLSICKAQAARIAENLKAAVAGETAIQILNHAGAELAKLSGAPGCVHEEDVRATARRLQGQLETARREIEPFVQARASVHDLFDTIHTLDCVSDGIRQSVMDMRMLPIGPLFTRFHRVIRDITRTNGKDIRLTISGEKTELDKRMIDELGDPMIHMIRNAADHGIESPEVREAAGKPRQGTISLDACHRGSNIVIRVSDDGRGLDADRIRAKAVEKGLVAAADAEQMSRQQIFQLIWLPGLSTAEKVSDVSGRGVGMDIVRSKINELSGVIEMDSELGQGTTFTIKLPLTLAILPSLMVEIDGDAFAIPLESVLEIIDVDRRDMTTVHGQWTAPIRDRVVGVLTLGALFKWGRRGNHSAAAETNRATLVIIGERKQQLGLAVDRVLGEEDVVIKSIAENYRNLAGIAGASILGDGRIALILDPPTLIEMSSQPLVATTDPQENRP